MNTNQRSKHTHTKNIESNILETGFFHAGKYYTCPILLSLTTSMYIYIYNILYIVHEKLLL